MMYDTPELGLAPPEPEIIGICPVCGGEIYAGEAVWTKDKEIICEWHLGAEIAQWLGYNKEVAQYG